MGCGVCLVVVMYCGCLVAVAVVRACIRILHLTSMKKVLVFFASIISYLKIMLLNSDGVFSNSQYD